MRNHSWLYHLTWVVCSRNVGKPQHPWRSQSLKHHNAQNGPPNKFCRDKIIFIELPQFNLSHNFLIFSMATKNGCVNEKIWLRIPIFWSSSGYKLNRSQDLVNIQSYFSVATCLKSLLFHSHLPIIFLEDIPMGFPCCTMKNLHRNHQIHILVGQIPSKSP